MTVPVARDSAARGVAYVIDKMVAAGAQTHLLTLATGLDRRRFEPSITCLIREGELAKDVRSAGIGLDALGLRRIYGWRALRSLAATVGRWRRERPAVVHTYLSSANIFGAIAARLAGVPCLVTSRRDTGFGDGLAIAVVQSWTSRWASRVVCVSEDVGRIVSRREHLSAPKLLVIPNGIDLERFSPRGRREEVRRALGVPPEASVVLQVGHLLPVKGTDILIEAAPRILAAAPRACFVIAGGGPLGPKLRQRVTELGLADRFLFVGFHGDVPDLLEAADLFVQPSRSEGQPNALLEAMAMGCACVATRVGGIPELAADGVDVLLVEPESPEPLAAACISLLESPDRARALGASARSRVRRERDAALMVSRYERLYEEALRGALAGRRIGGTRRDPGATA